ncbi:interleukin-1 receptor type 1-like isoform X2 [Hoplias malabaricus]|uniref:interleukin-1 receptor type 1-like isoform X2 n=1 Tax=Hoplias malabaricus TaxID=27720 RepID=UPI003461F9C8
MQSAVLLLFSWTASISYVSKCEQIFAVEHHTVRLHCCICKENVDNITVNWTKDNYTVKTSPRIKLQGISLWLLNTEPSDSGHYACTGTSASETKESQFFLSVEKGPCPTATDLQFALERTNTNLTCTKDPVETFGEILQINWLKDCEPTGLQGSVVQLNVSLSSNGNYTCEVVFRREGDNYTISHTTQLQVLKDEPTKGPEVLHPRNLTMYIKPGVNITLNCSVFIGSEQDIMETSVYWTVNDSFTDGLQDKLTLEKGEDNETYGTSTLFISEVSLKYFDEPFQCIVLNSKGSDFGLVWLRQIDSEGDPSAIQTPLIIALALTVVTIALAIVLFIYFRIDIILAYRHLRGKGKAPAEGRKIYNAYVSYCHGNSTDSSVAEDLALRVIPEVLEQQHGLKLFIHGRDNTEVNMADAVSQSKVVLLVLPGSQPASRAEEESSIPLNPGQDRLSVSHCGELYRVIAQSSVRVIVVESGENADYSLLPESIQSIIRRDGVLKWSPALQLSGRFWKHLRYHMT